MGNDREVDAPLGSQDPASTSDEGASFADPLDGAGGLSDQVTGNDEEEDEEAIFADKIDGASGLSDQVTANDEDEEKGASVADASDGASELSDQGTANDEEEEEEEEYVGPQSDTPLGGVFGQEDMQRGSQATTRQEDTELGLFRDEL